MTPNRLAPLALLGAVAIGCAATAEKAAPPVTLAQDAALAATFGGVSNVVELADGRVAFADTKDKRFLLADFATGKVDTVGTQVDSLAGDAAGQYKFPGAVAHLAGDTLALVDFAATRTTLWTDRGAFARVLPLPAVGGATPVLTYDRAGHGYKTDFTAVLGGGEPGTPVRPDSLAVLRISLGNGAVDTVARLSAPEYGDATFGEQVQSVAKVFGPNDAFGATADGAVWVARARSFSVDWRAPDGTWTRGKPHAWTKVPVTEADRAAVLERLYARGLPKGVEVKFPFAETKPAFELALTRATGEVWLQYSRAKDTDAARYAVFGRDGAFVRDAIAPAGVLLAGVGATKAYGVTKTADGRRQLVRLAVP